MLVIRTVQYQVFCREHEQNTASTANQNHVFFIFNMLEATDE